MKIKMKTQRTLILNEKQIKEFFDGVDEIKGLKLDNIAYNRKDKTAEFYFKE